MKKFLMKGSLLASFVLMRLTSKAGVFTDVLDKWQDEVEGAFPIVTGIAFIVFAWFDYKYFFGKEKDYKTGIINIAVFAGVILVIVGVYKFITSQSL